MEELKDKLCAIFADEITKAVYSNSKGTQYRKITAQRKAGSSGNQSIWQLEKLTEKQAFHEALPYEELLEFSEQMATEGFRQMNFWSRSQEYSLKLSKGGKVLFRKTALEKPTEQAEEGHNRKKQYLLEEGMAIEPLYDMGVFTKEGKIVRSMYDKYRQINKFIEMIDDVVERFPEGSLHVIDFGCGKSYLTFVVYFYLTEIRKRDVHMLGLDLKEDVIAKCQEAARKYGYSQLQFQVGDINGYQTEHPVDLVISLHACDTATDYALFNAVCWKAKAIISVPCCQHELFGQLSSEELPIFQRYGIVKERTAALMTDAVRANLLECCGYKTQLLEFVDLTHTPKNILIRAVRTSIPSQHKRLLLKETRSLLHCFHLHPTFYQLLIDAGFVESE